MFGCSSERERSKITQRRKKKGWKKIHTSQVRSCLVHLLYRCVPMSIPIILVRHLDLLFS